MKDFRARTDKITGYAVCNDTNLPMREYTVEGWFWHIYPTLAQAESAAGTMPEFYWFRPNDNPYQPNPKNRIRHHVRPVSEFLRSCIKEDEKPDLSYQFIGDAHRTEFKEDGLLHAIERIGA